MQIMLGKRGDYAVRAVLDLAQHHHQGLRKAREIAVTMRIPAGYLPQILASLVRAGLLEATAGRDGGYRLARSPQAISMLEVVEAAEGPLNVVRSCVLRDIPCGQGGYCAAHETWSGAQEAMARKLNATSFRQLAR
jgi:Rrf2 family protein